MLELQRNTLTKAIKLLNSIGVEYAIVAGEEKHGTLEIVTKKQKSKNRSRSYSAKYGKGALRDHIRPYIEPLKVGDVACIPIASFDLTAIATASASYAHQLFGKGGHIGRTDQKKQVFEIMRLET